MFFGSGCSSLFSVYLGCSYVSCCLGFCFSNLVWFFRSSISLSSLVNISFVLEGTLVRAFSRRCCVWAVCNNSTFFKRVGGPSWMFVLLGFLKCWTFGLMVLMFPLTAFAQDFLKFTWLLPVFHLLLVGVYMLDSWTFWISFVAANVW